MMIPTRLLVLQRLTTLLEGITEVEGKAVDLAHNVFRGRNLVGAEVKPYPALSILEAPRPDIAVFAGEEGFMRKDRWTLLIQGLAEEDLLNPSDSAYYLCAAVEQRLHRIQAVKRASGTPEFPEDYMLGNLITALEIAPPVVRPPEDKVSSTAYFFLPIRVGIAVDSGQPYTDA